MQTYDIQVKPMGAFGVDMRQKAAAVFVDGYYQDLAFLSKERNKLIETFAQMICPDVFYLASLDEEIVGILACSNKELRAMTIDQAILRKSFGWVKGSLAYLFMNGEFNKKLSYNEDTGYIECVATAEKARGKGVSTALFHYAMEHAPYTRYVLEVVDTNENAYRLYKKLGFAEFERKKEQFSKLKGFQERIYMEMAT
ncbi:Acetyltransferase (GNAT) family protein [Evansella caseinilytica]|uniref:Acetyltransferase (GNAT) family protein n=1 Tax=Evansella caseinilytica TaxID=1503961 RepID=A0A1H3SWJ6_9BACI|nr:GNAT family N-acetyltransferase [Evansella caseinilytica]SDZ41921.1 Acetyltransferase (GNAT) family protein [Evansella caseinilytica]